MKETARLCGLSGWPVVTWLIEQFIKCVNSTPLKNEMIVYIVLVLHCHKALENYRERMHGHVQKSYCVVIRSVLALSNAIVEPYGPASRNLLLRKAPIAVRTDGKMDINSAIAKTNKPLEISNNPAATRPS